MKTTDESILFTLKIVFGSTRPMPALFTRNGDRSISYCVDYDGLSADDDYELACQAYYTYWEFKGRILNNKISDLEDGCIIKIGEDVALGAYVLEKTDQYASFSKLREAIIEENIRLNNVPKEMEKNTELVNIPIKHVLKIQLIQNYIDYCLWFGRARADGFGWGGKSKKEI